VSDISDRSYLRPKLRLGRYKHEALLQKNIQEAELPVIPSQAGAWEGDEYLLNGCFFHEGFAHF
jgi:hypothetical protein